MVKINRLSPPSPGLMGQLMLAGCYDNVSRIIIWPATPLHQSTINFSSIKMLLCRSGWRKAGPDKERISSNLAGGGGPIFSNGKYIISQDSRG